MVDRFYDIWTLELCRLSDAGFCQNSSSAKHHYSFHKFIFHWNPAIHKHPATVRNPISCTISCTSSVFHDHKFPFWYLECMRQTSGMQKWINDHKCSGSVSMSTDSLGMLGILDLMLLGGAWIPLIAMLTPQKKRRQQARFVVEHYK